MENTQKPEDTTELNQDELSREESEKLDADLHGIDMLYRSRCVQAPAGTNVKIREIEPEDK